MEREESSLVLKRARGGSREDLDALFAKCGEPLLAYIRLRLGPELRAHLESGDILQATLLRAFTRFEQFQGSGSKSLVGWLVAIARNQIRDEVDFFRARRRDVARTVPLTDDLERIAQTLCSEASRIELKDETKHLEQTLESMKPQHREVVLLRKYEELSFPEIGERLAKSPDACRMLYARAMTALTRAVRSRADGREARS